MPELESIVACTALACPVAHCHQRHPARCNNENAAGAKALCILIILTDPTGKLLVHSYCRLEHWLLDQLLAASAFLRRRFALGGEQEPQYCGMCWFHEAVQKERPSTLHQLKSWGIA